MMEGIWIGVEFFSLIFLGTRTLFRYLKPLGVFSSFRDKMGVAIICQFYKQLHFTYFFALWFTKHFTLIYVIDRQPCKASSQVEKLRPKKLMILSPKYR